MKKIFAILLVACTLLFSACTTKGNQVYYLTISRTEFALEVGDQTTLIAMYGDDSKAITFTSEDEKVATITKDGKITAVGVGSTYIVVSVDGQSKVCLVNVSQHDYLVQLDYQKTDYIIVGAQLLIDVLLYKDGIRYEGNVSSSVNSLEGCSLTKLDKSTFVFSASQAGEYKICINSDKASAEITVVVKTAEQVIG